MKLYTKTIDGSSYTMPANKIVVIKDGMQIFNPTEDILLSDGWKEYIAPKNELTDEQILTQEKESKTNDVIEYDSSEEVNIFYVNNIPIWLDKATRSGLMLRLQAESAVGITETSLWYNSIEFKLSVSAAIQILYSLEVYASKCYDNTQYHIANIAKIETLEDLKSYDHKEGYPDKLSFSF
jgi:hypothetical protein